MIRYVHRCVTWRVLWMYRDAMAVLQYKTQIIFGIVNCGYRQCTLIHFFDSETKFLCL